ncbi:flavodoxin [Rhodococcoides trifolii]|uniref:Flavodoxin n=1 Tax=Rhodococcoides trifolii TaxID=908250 RepID=A0A917G785_9NOCA|nr:flavodoxin domain-containing protein [Rhodococcus trifolii]GGG25685.1 flavodoxin [Rhodococcus trifolii]
MRVLIATASRHGATREIGDRIAVAIREGFRRHSIGDEVLVQDCDDVDAVADYDAVVLGSAVYMGRWLKSARILAEREFSELETRPVWLFSSGPLGDSNKEPPKGKWDKASWALEHRVFGGKIDRAVLSRRERLVVTLIKAANEDDRCWSDIDAWADHICTHLTALARQTAVN